MKNKEEIINKIASYCCYACEMSSVYLPEKNGYICNADMDYKKCELCQYPAENIYQIIMEMKK